MSIAFLLPGYGSTPVMEYVSGSVNGTAWASGQRTTSDQGSWNATQNAGGNWTYSGSGSTSSDDSNDASYSGGGSFSVGTTASGSYSISGSGSYSYSGSGNNSAGGGTISESGHQDISSGDVSNYTVGSSSGVWLLQSDSASGSDNGSTSWSYSGTANYNDYAVIGSISALPVPFYGIPINSGSVSGTSKTNGNTTTTSQDNWTANENASGMWSYSGSGTTTIGENASMSYSGSGNFTQTMVDTSEDGSLSAGGTVTESGYSNTTVNDNKAFQLGSSGMWLQQSASGSGEATWCTGWSYNGSGTYSYLSYSSGSGSGSMSGSGSATLVTGTTSGTGGQTLDPGGPRSATPPGLPPAQVGEMETELARLKFLEEQNFRITIQVQNRLAILEKNKEPSPFWSPAIQARWAQDRDAQIKQATDKLDALAKERGQLQSRSARLQSSIARALRQNGSAAEKALLQAAEKERAALPPPKTVEQYRAMSREQWLMSGTLAGLEERIHILEARIKQGTDCPGDKQFVAEWSLQRDQLRSKYNALGDALEASHLRDTAEKEAIARILARGQADVDAAVANMKARGQKPRNSDIASLIFPNKGPWPVRLVRGFLRAGGNMLIGTVELADDLVSDPGKMYNAMKALATDAEVRKQVANQILKQIEEKVRKAAQGDAGAIGELTFDIVINIPAGIGAAQKGSQAVRLVVRGTKASLTALAKKLTSKEGAAALEKIAVVTKKVEEAEKALNAAKTAEDAAAATERLKAEQAAAEEALSAWENEGGALSNGSQAPKALRGSQQGAAQLQNRAAELNTMRRAWEAKNGTTAVIKVQNKATGEVKTLIATEGKTMPKEFVGKLRPGEEFIGDVGHAEQTILQNLGPDWVAIEGGASRNVCKGICQPLVEGSGMKLGGPEFRGAADKTPFRMFWQE